MNTEQKAQLSDEVNHILACNVDTKQGECDAVKFAIGFIHKGYAGCAVDELMLNLIHEELVEAVGFFAHVIVQLYDGVCLTIDIITFKGIRFRGHISKYGVE